MHVLVPVLHRPEKPTGVCRHAVNLAQCLAERREVEQITLIIGSWQKNYFRDSFDLVHPKIRLVEVNIRNSSIARNVWYLSGLPKLAQQLKPDIVHLSFPLPFIRQLFRVPVVATIHDLYPYECPDNFGYPQVWFNQWFLHQCVANSDGLSCVSKTTLKHLKHYFPRLTQVKPAKVIYNSVDFKKVTPSKPEESSLYAGQPFFLCVAQHRQNKNLDLLIQAFSNLKKGNKISKDTHLILVGSPGPETPRLQQFIQSLHLNHQVEFLSGLGDGELRWLYEKAALFVIPSSTEGFCMPLIEAQALSCKTVCSDIPIFREISGDNCYYFTLNGSSVENLTQAISKAWLDEDRCKPFINPNFLKGTVAQEYINLYATVRASKDKSNS